MARPQQRFSLTLNDTFGLDDKGSYPIYRSYTAAFSIQF